MLNLITQKQILQLIDLHVSNLKCADLSNQIPLYHYQIYKNQLIHQFKKDVLIDHVFASSNNRLLTDTDSNSLSTSSYQNLVNFTENVDFSIDNLNFFELKNLNTIFLELKLKNIDSPNFNVVGSSTYEGLSTFQDMDLDITLLENEPINQGSLSNFFYNNDLNLNPNSLDLEELQEDYETLVNILAENSNLFQNDGFFFLFHYKNLNLEVMTPLVRNAIQYEYSTVKLYSVLENLFINIKQYPFLNFKSEPLSCLNPGELQIIYNEQFINVKNHLQFIITTFADGSIYIPSSNIHGVGKFIHFEPNIILNILNTAFNIDPELLIILF
jgi:hypothetical protein